MLCAASHEKGARRVPEGDGALHQEPLAALLACQAAARPRRLPLRGRGRDRDSATAAGFAPWTRSPRGGKDHSCGGCAGAPAPCRVRPYATRAPSLTYLKGGTSSTVRGCVTKLVIPLVLVGLLSYVVLPSLVEDQISRRLQGSIGAPTRPEVDVSCSFPPWTLLGRIHRGRLRSDG